MNTDYKSKKALFLFKNTLRQCRSTLSLRKRVSTCGSKFFHELLNVEIGLVFLIFKVFKGNALVHIRMIGIVSSCFYRSLLQDLLLDNFVQIV